MQRLVHHVWQKTEYDTEAVKLTVDTILTGRVKVELQQLVDLA